MKPEDLRRAFKLLFENFWIIRKNLPEEYTFLRRHQNELNKILQNRFGMNMTVRREYIQLLKRPHQLESWMGIDDFSITFDFTLFSCAMAYVETLEAETPFMLEDIIRDIEMNKPEDMALDWTNYNHRKSFIRVIKKMARLSVIEMIQGETSTFEQSEENQEILFTTTIMARALLSRAPKSYTQYEKFQDYWWDFNENRILEGNQVLYQRLMMEPIIERTEANEETFTRLKNYFHHMKNFSEENTSFQFELYRDYAAFTLEDRHQWKDIFPSRKVVDEILIQLATIIRKDNLSPSPYGQITISFEKWMQFVEELKKVYEAYWSKEYKEMTLSLLSRTVFERGKEWSLFQQKDEEIIIQPVFGRLVAEMRNEDE